MIVVPNERLLAVVGKGIPFHDALKKADEVLLHATQGISTLITVTGLVNVDFADVRTVMQEGGSALMGTGVGRGENRATDAAQQAMASPLLDNVSVSGATGVLVNITGGDDLTLGDVHQIVEIVKDAVGDDAEIIFGTVNEKAMQGECRVTVIATGFDKNPPSSISTAPSAMTSSNTMPPRGTPVIQLPLQRTTSRPVTPPRGVPTPDIPRKVTPLTPPPSLDKTGGQDLSDMEIPTFIRRQMD
jgi:cell division protein FtsZ